MFKPAYLINEKFDDIYFDVINAIDEAQHNFFMNNNLTERLVESIKSANPFVIGETGFGTGRVLVSLMEFIKKNGFKDISIEYYSVELYPITVEKMLTLLECFQAQSGDSIATLAEAYRCIDITVPGWHYVEIRQAFGVIALNLWIGEALDMVTNLPKSCDAWFLDGHSPKKNPEIWRPELLMAIGEKTKTGGSCSTYTVAGTVKRGLTAAGFAIEKCPGCHGKNHVLKGVKY